MENSALIRLIKSLSKKEVREMHQFLTSPFFNKREEVISLFTYLSTLILNGKAVPSKATVFKAVSKNSLPFDDQRLRLWMSYLLKSIEQYLVHTALFEDKVEVKLKSAEVYRQRNLINAQSRQIRELTAAIELIPNRNAAYFEHQFQIQLEQYRLTSANRRMDKLNLQKMSDSLDVAFFIKKLRQSCLAFAHQSVYKTNYEFGLLEEILVYIKAKGLLNIPAIAVYYYSYKIISDPAKTNNFFTLKKLLNEHNDLFPPDELGDLYLMAINFCIKRYNAGAKDFLKEELELYQYGLNQGLFLINNELSRYTYRNIVTVGVVLESFEWVAQFIEAYKNLLPREHRISTYSYCSALLAYSKKNYKEALQLLQNADYKDVLLNLSAKTVLLKIFYELKEFDLLSAHLDAMRIFIRRKKIIAYHQENYINLIRFTRKIVEHNPYDKSAKIKLAGDIKNTKVVAEKGWLLAQVKNDN